ncbi:MULTISPECIES: hypothetical protein [unclassified Arcicella]|uniref:hypothetical protein n=1 Tax=unclassified Arcicella TaxID=2644986 RepID=UPI0028664CA4|nr:MULTISPECIES: hypothetical protein [unclassified Arcicella]MDR6562182.1 hypothetical protein [Arcicella sp. BE51]MDR6812123.1 hypothetical protein [Arcicella sp. BE140]MDR6823435.1 hypothetical protein [Arcicella sp. BE139]
MEIQLILGRFSAKEALELITQMIHVKIKYHEGKISSESNEEDIKRRESRIKELQHDLAEIRKYVQTQGETVNIDARILI